MKNKTRKLLGRFTAALIILALVLSVFSCARAPTEDGATVDSLKTENNIPPENNAEKTGEKTDSLAENAKDLDTNEAEQNNEAQDPMAFTVNDKFSAYEVAVVLTDEETAKNKEYTIADFDGYDIFYVAHFSCYPEEYYPQYKNKRGLVLYLNEPSKERVLEYCEKLSKDSRVELAEPNILNHYQKRLYVSLSDEGIEKYDEISKKWFSEIDLDYLYLGVDGKGNIALVLNECDEEFYYKQFRVLLNNKYVKSIRPFYLDIVENRIDVYITHERYVENPVFTLEDFPESNFKFITKMFELETDLYDSTKKVPVYCMLRLTLDENTKKIYKVIELLKNNPIIMHAFPDEAVFTNEGDMSLYITD